MSDHLDRLFDEVDRQLEEVREQALALATRSGLLISAAAVAAAVLAGRLNSLPGDFGWVLWPLGFALLAGMGALAPLLTVGPRTESLVQWMPGKMKDKQARIDLYLGKVVTLDANRTRLVVMTCAFYLEVAAVAVAVVLSLIVAARR
jgi:hypothetical protein